MDADDEEASNAGDGEAETSADGDSVEPAAAGEIVLEVDGERYAGPIDECQIEDGGPILVTSSGVPQITLNLGRQGERFGALNAGVTFEDGTGVGVSTNDFEAEVDGKSIMVSADGFFATDGSGQVGSGVVTASGS